MANFEAKLLVVEKKHGAELVDAAKYEEKCNEVHNLKATMEEKNKGASDVGDNNDVDENDVNDVSSHAYANKCKEVERLQA